MIFPVSRSSSFAASSLGAAVAFVAFVSVPRAAFADEVVTETAEPAGPPTRTDVKEDKPAPATTPTTYHGHPFWVDADVGFESADLATFQANRTSFTANIVPTIASGPAAHLGLGFRFYSLTFGLRAGTAWFGDTGIAGNMQLYDIDAEIGLRFPFDRLEPYLALGGGYSVIGGLGDALEGVARGIDIDGANLRLVLGLDYFFNRTVSVGVRGTGEVVFLSRRGVPLRDIASVNSFDQTEAELLEGSGSTIGTAFTLCVGPGLHF